ncbi:MAG: NUDIX hydrolase [Actinomycetota bacterium]|jgi:8-oxo-dGTP pyrophosphatase MutT (NUDIX family)|nr:NUDIX hydrolase [Actinomycetota bacterium]
MIQPPANPWRTTATRQIYSNPWIRVREDAVVRADGSDGVYGVVELRSLALGVVVRFDDGTTVLVGQHRYTMDAWSWEIPEGGGALHGNPREEAARELVEETGLRAATWTELGDVEPSNSITDQRGLLWLAEDLTQQQATPDPTEALALWRLPLSTAITMALEGELTDALSVVGLCRADHVLRRRSQRP